MVIRFIIMVDTKNIIPNKALIPYTLYGPAMILVVMSVISLLVFFQPDAQKRALEHAEITDILLQQPPTREILSDAYWHVHQSLRYDPTSVRQWIIKAHILSGLYGEGTSYPHPENALSVALQLDPSIQGSLQRHRQAIAQRLQNRVPPS